MQVEQIMSDQIATQEPNTTLHEVVGIMLENGIGSVLIHDNGDIGIITRSDILNALYSRKESLLSIQANQAMSHPVITTKPSTAVSTVIRRMGEQGIRKLPVRKKGKIIGIVTFTDIVEHHPELVRQLRSELDQRDEWTD